MAVQETWRKVWYTQDSLEIHIQNRNIIKVGNLSSIYLYFIEFYYISYNFFFNITPVAWECASYKTLKIKKEIVRLRLKPRML